MSGTKFKHFLAGWFCLAGLYAVDWFIGSVPAIPDERDLFAYVLYPASFPDSLCLMSAWSPVYPGFGIQEGWVYGGGPGFGLSIKTQYHRLMSNHQLTAGFPILDESFIKAGLQFHYDVSWLHNVEALHKVSCSGAVILQPDPAWQLSFYSKHILSFPRDSTEHILVPETGSSISYKLNSNITLKTAVRKRSEMPWQLFVGMSFAPIKGIVCLVDFEFSGLRPAFGVLIRPGHWRVMIYVDRHRYLGWSQQIVIGYEK